MYSIQQQNQNISRDGLRLASKSPCVNTALLSLPAPAKSAKAHWADPALAIFLAGYYDVATLAAARELGAFFEAWVVHHLRVLAELLTPRGRLFYWRTIAGQEVDLVIEQGQHLLAIEMKWSKTVRFADADGLRLFLQQHPQAVGGVLLYRGAEVRRLDERILALPVGLMLGV